MKSLKYVVAMLLLLSLSACGGGGGSTPSAPPAATKAVLKLNLTGALPADTAIVGTVITITLPVNVTPELVNNAIAPTVITTSGTFAGGAVAPIIYTASTNTIQLTFVNAAVAGITQVGEIATITLQLANKAARDGRSIVSSALLSPSLKTIAGFW